MAQVLNSNRSAKARLGKAKEQLDVVEKTCDGQIKKGLKTCQERNELIKRRLAQIFGKFERVLHEQGRVDIDKRP